ncbi:MAG TPA: hypothetical protein VE641_01440, partial [Chthoniobacterales bacterium]|nr:hypothetical protein [Chthoniobacterales bacterium]
MPSSTDSRRRIIRSHGGTFSPGAAIAIGLDVRNMEPFMPATGAAGQWLLPLSRRKNSVLSGLPFVRCRFIGLIP